MRSEPAAGGVLLPSAAGSPDTHSTTNTGSAMAATGVLSTAHLHHPLHLAQPHGLEKV
jgi:hypothetical protein